MTIPELLEDKRWRKKGPAGESAIAEAEAAFGVPFPESLREVYGVCDGAEVMYEGIRILPLAEAVKFGNMWIEPEKLPGFALFPLVEFRDQGHLLSVCGPLAEAHVLWWYDDGEPALLYRSVETMLAAIVNGHDGTDYPTSLLNDFSIQYRNPQERATAAKLIGLSPRDGSFATRFCAFVGTALLSPIDVELLEPLAYRGGVMREAALTRLSEFEPESEEAKQALERIAKDYQDYLTRCSEILTMAGFEMTERAGINFEMLYAMRNDPDFDERLAAVPRKKPPQAKSFVERLKGLFGG